jgi:hypothetical protein
MTPYRSLMEIVTILVSIPQDVAPDWAAAEAKLASVSLDEALDGGFAYAFDLRHDSNEGPTEANLAYLEAVKRQLAEDLVLLRKAREGEAGALQRRVVGDHYVFVAAHPTEQGRPDGSFAALDRLGASGLLRAAGFSE